jgi:C-terminal processing protease CtpA/Prc
MKKILYLSVVLLAGLILGCGKGKSTNPGGTAPVYPTSPTKTGTTVQLIEDSIYLYAAEDYLWYNQLPTYATFEPRSFTNPDALTALQNELDALSQYALNPLTTPPSPYEYSSYDPGTAKYSFIDDGTETAALNGVKGDFGFDVQYNLVNDLRVEYVYAGSPAGLAGMARGDEVMSINGSTNITYDAPGYGTGTSTNLNFVSNAVYNSGSIVMIMKRPDASTYTVNLTTANYNVNPVLKDTILTTAKGTKLGYIVFNSFVSESVADPVLNAAFANFAAKGITDLAVDLRYNGGGYVSTAEHLDNLIVPPSKTGTLMYNTYYNDNLVNGKDPLLHNQWRSGSPDYNYGQFDYSVAGNAVNFAKTGSLNINRVFFIITGQTASASELTINNLRPEMDVQFVGETSYGKPVGFFDLDINKYIMYTPEFSVQNSAGQGGYYAGFTPGATGYPGVNAYDDLTRNWGDPKETLLASILNYLGTGSYATSNPNIHNLKSGSFANSFNALNPKKEMLNKHKFLGMIGKRNLKLTRKK